MIIARCPACQTVFRARPEQLSAHAGRVRCGHCLSPFNAFDNLVDNGTQDPASSDIDIEADLDASPVHAKPAQTPVPKAEHEPQPLDLDAFFVFQEPSPDAPTRRHINPWILEEKTPGIAGASIPNEWPDLTTDDDAAQASGENHPSTFERMADRLDFIVPDEFQTTPSNEGGANSNGYTSSLDGVTDEDSRMEGPSRLAFPVSPSTAASIAQEDDVDTAAVNGAQGSPSDILKPRLDERAQKPFEIDLPASAVIRRRAPQHAKAATPGPTSPEAEDSVHHDSPGVHRYRETQASPGRRWFMGLGIGILLGTLSAQVAYNFRGDITRHWPQLRPLYLELCAQLGCELPLPRVAAAIRITNSNLESDPTEPTRFVLNASIANQARHPLAFPYLELTLTNARDRSIVRRVLRPEEWTRDADISKGLAAGQEIEIRLAFSAPDLTDATGYRVYAFYP